MSTPHNTTPEQAKLIEKGRIMANTICASTKYSYAVGDLVLTRSQRAELAAYIAFIELQRDTHYVAVSALLQRIRDDAVLAWILYSKQGGPFEALIDAVALHKGVAPESIRKLYTPKRSRDPETPVWHPLTQLLNAGTAVLLANKDGGVYGGFCDGERWVWDDGMPATDAFAWTDKPMAPTSVEIAT